MNRRRYLAGAGAAAFGGLAGCSRARQEIDNVVQQADNAQAASGFDFPPGLSSNGVESYEKLYLAHVNALVDRTFTAEFVEDPNVERSGGRIRVGGTSGSIRWEVDHNATWYTDLYFEENLRYAGTPVGVEQKPSQLEAGVESRNFSTWLMDAVGARFGDALEPRYGYGDLSIQTEGETDVATFVVEEFPEKASVTDVETLELAVGADGIIRRIDARFTDEIRGQPSSEKRFEYSIDLGAELSGRPEEVAALPRLGVEWQNDGRVLAVTNDGEWPVVGRSEQGDLFLDGLDRGDSAFGAAVSVESPLGPGETGYISADDGVVLTASPPDRSPPVIRTDEELRFRYRYDGEEHGGPYELRYSVA